MAFHFLSSSKASWIGRSVCCKIRENHHEIFHAETAKEQVVWYRSWCVLQREHLQIFLVGKRRRFDLTYVSGVCQITSIFGLILVTYVPKTGRRPKTGSGGRKTKPSQKHGKQTFQNWKWNSKSLSQKRQFVMSNRCFQWCSTFLPIRKKFIKSSRF